MKRYICIDAFQLEKVDDDGFFTEEYVDIPEGALYQRTEDPFRLVGADDTVRLSGIGISEGVWMEITAETLAAHFEEVMA